MNISLKPTAILFISSLFCLSGYGQEKFREGYIITLQQDTIHGRIGYKTAIKNATKCKFKAGKEADIRTYTPEEIAGYRFADGKYYVAKSVEVNGQAKSVFLEYLIDGIADIYFFRDETSDHYFINKESEGMVPLVVDVVEYEQGGRKYTKRKDTYRQVLKYLLADAPDLSSKISKTELRHEDLIDIAESYHNQVCEEYECVSYSKKKSSVQTRIGLLIGGNNSRIAFDGSYYLRQQLLTDFSASSKVSFGVFLQLQDPFISERFALQPELWYGRAEYTTPELSLSHSYIKLPVLLRYTSIHRKVRPTFAFGPTGKFLLNVEANETNASNRSWMEEGRFLLGMEGVLGVVYALSEKKNISLEGRYNLSFGTHRNLFGSGSSNQQDQYKSKTNTFSIVTGFSF